MRVITFPAWDTVPYDRVGPDSDIVARRIAALAKLALTTRKHPTIVLTTVNAIVQRVPPRSFIKRTIKTHGAGPAHRHGAADAAPRAHGLHAHAAPSWSRASTPCAAASSTSFRPGGRARCASTSSATRWRRSRPSTSTTQRTTKPVQKLALMPVSEVAFGDEAEKLFRSRYVELFGGNTGDDPLYEAVSAGHRYPGQEHWLPLFHDHLETLFDYLPGVPVSFDHRSDEAAKSRFEQIAEHYEARTRGAGGAQVRRRRPTSRCRRSGCSSMPSRWPRAALTGRHVVR